MKYFSTFSGIAGFELGIGDKGECVGFSETNKYANQIYLKHFPKHKQYGDITKIIASEVPDHDLFVGGFPCQSFSIAGKRGGFKDTRGTLFFDIARILKCKEPNYLLLENVKGLISHNEGKTLETILETLQELGYYVNIEVYNSKFYGVPQNRERIFFLCRHIKTLISTGQKQKLNLSSPVIKEFLFQILLNNLIEVQKLQETNSKDWVLGWIFLKEILRGGMMMKQESLEIVLTKLQKISKNKYQTELLVPLASKDMNSEEENTKDGILIAMEENKSILKTEDLWENIDILLNNELEEGLIGKKLSTTLMVIKQIIKTKTYTFTNLSQAIGLVIVQLRNSSKDLWNEVLLDLIVIKEHTKKYARINNKKEKIIITETGNAYIISNLQNFEKYFVTGHLRGTSRPKVFPIGGGDEKALKQIIGGGQGSRVYDPEGISSTIVAQAGGHGGKTGLYVIGGTQKNASIMKDRSPALTEAMGKGGGHTPMIMPILTPDRPNKRQNGRRIKEDGDPSFTLTGQDRHGVMIVDKKGKQKNKDYASTLTGGGHSGGNHSDMDLLFKGVKIRRLTPKECMRLQGFPDHWCDVGADGKEISDSQKYKLAGNAVTVNVIKAIMERLL